jgi:Ser/Thr protein kinase RdoA (MazF antagonist)
MKFFPIQSSIPSSDSLKEFLSTHYNLGKVYDCYLFSNGFNLIFCANTKSGKYFLRISRPDFKKSITEVDAEINLLISLAESGFAVVRPVSKVSGEFTSKIKIQTGTSIAVLFAEVPGSSLFQLNSKQIYLLGKKLADIHTHTDNTTKKVNRGTIDLDFLFTQPIKVLEHSLEDRSLFLYLKKVGAGAAKKLKEYQDQGIIKDYGLCHGDFHHLNVHWKSPAQPIFFDFDLFGYGYRIFDLATFLWAIRYLGKTEDEIGLQWKNFLKGYGVSKKPFSAEEIEGIYLYGLLREIWRLGYLFRMRKHLGQYDLNREFLNKRVQFIKDWKKQYGISLY